MKFSTKAIHVGQEADTATGATIVPIYQTSTFTQEEIGKTKGYDYSRSDNPTRAALESTIASLENGKFGLAFASGLAAETAVLSILRPGDNIVAMNDLYGGTYRLFTQVLAHQGITTTFVDGTDLNNVESAITKNTKLIWVETPTNPLLKLTDISAVSDIAKEQNVLLVVDNTFATPYFQKPLDLGADIVVHSTTKYINGHSDVVGGAVITSNADLNEKIKFYQNSAGAILGPFDSWLTLRGLKTLSVRMEKHEKNAIKIANALVKHPNVLKVNYPGLESHPQHELAKKQMSGFGGMISFEVNGLRAEAEGQNRTFDRNAVYREQPSNGNIAEVNKFVKELKIFSLAESLGGVESLVSHPAQMTHASIPAEQRKVLGINDNLIRLSVGIEDEEDLIADLKYALDSVSLSLKS